MADHHGPWGGDSPIKQSAAGIDEISIGGAAAGAAARSPPAAASGPSAEFVDDTADHDPHAHVQLKPEVSRIQSSADKNYWSKRNKLWKKFFVDKPRVPADDDNPDKEEAKLWDARHHPASLMRFLGDGQNQETTRALRELAEGIAMRNVIIQGEPSSGKTAVIETFLREWKREVGKAREERAANGDFDTEASKKKNVFGKKKKKKITDDELPDPILRLTWEDAKNLAAMEGKISAWIENLNKFADVIEQRVMFLEGLCQLSPNQQQWTYRIMDRYAMVGEPARPLFFLFTCYDFNRIIAKLKMRVHLMRMTRLEPTPSLELFLSLMVKEKVGFEREALELIYQRVGPHVGHMINMVQQVFYKHKYVSFINASKETAPEILSAWKDSKMRFFEFKLLGDAKVYTNPWIGQVPRIRILTLEGEVTQASFLITFCKTGQAMQTAQLEAKHKEHKMRKDVEKMEMDDLHNLFAKTGGGAGESPTRQTSKTTTPVRQESTATVASMASTGAPGTPGTPSRSNTLRRTDSDFGGDERAGSPARTPSRATMRGGTPKRAATPSKVELQESVDAMRRDLEIVDDPWLTIRHISDKAITRRIDFALKRKGHNEWVFVEYLTLDSLLYDPRNRMSALSKVCEERPIIRLEHLTKRTEGHSKKWAANARMRDPRHQGRYAEICECECEVKCECKKKRDFLLSLACLTSFPGLLWQFNSSFFLRRFIPASKLELIDLSRPRQNFQVEGYHKSGIKKDNERKGKDGKSLGGGFDGSRTRWFQLKLHEYFEGKQCWRLNIKGDPEWEGFGNASRKEFENI